MREAHSTRVHLRATMTSPIKMSMTSPSVATAPSSQESALESLKVYRGWWIGLLCIGTLCVACDDAQRRASPEFGAPPSLPDRAVTDAHVAQDMGLHDAEIQVDYGDEDMPSSLLNACENGLDDDEDGLIDYPVDPGCASPDDPDEQDRGERPVIAQCQNGLDDDEDGYADLADPDCSDVNDPRERPVEGESPPACSDGLDNDEDGLTDAFEDPGCAHFGDQDELDLEEPPACFNQLDDDRDGLIDYPLDPGCVSLGDRSEQDPSLPTACRDGVDNDEDGATDFPQDLGCESASSLSERPICLSDARLIEAQRGVRYRATSEQGRHGRSASCGGRGAPDFTLYYRLSRPVRRLMVHTEGSWETTLSAHYRCGEGEELACAREPVGDGGRNTLTIPTPQLGAYYITVDGASAIGGEVELWVEEEAIEACQDGLDNDGDGLIDAPLDPGCTSPADLDETTPSPAPHCGDGLDNDEDGQVDYPQDRGCYQASDPSEEDECGAGVRVLPLGGRYPLSVTSTSSTPEQTSELSGSCGQSQGFEAVYVINNPSHARFTFELTRTDGMAGFASLYLRAGSCLAGPELGCASALLSAHELGQERPEGSTLQLEVTSAPQGPLFLIIDHPLDGLPYELSVTRDQLPPRCRDEQDNDADGYVDQEDPGCEGPEDETELDPERATECHDLLDNDADGYFDYPYDPGCLYRGGRSELDPELTPSCSNGLDDNADGYVDFPYDPGCSSRGDEVEAVSATPPECFNERDDDGDGVIDFPQDPGCTARGDRAEQDERWRPQCSDGLDNDRDGATDYPFDVDCVSRGTRSERAQPGPLPVCSNGEDDDLDGAVDFPFDPGCNSAADDSEGDPELLPICANRYDDDGNGRVDWPDDPGCSYSADQSEEGIDFPNPRCADGIDNDLDGAIDLADRGCISTRDDDELDEHSAPVGCHDGLDNDGDGLIDWPLDYGCGGSGDPCEQGGHIACVSDGAEVCVDVLSHPSHCGACDQACPSGVDCIEGFCGGERPLRDTLLRCIYTARPPADFLIGPLSSPAGEPLLSALINCSPNDQTQALLLPRNSTSALTRSAQVVRRYVENGGTLITERGRASQVYELITGRQVALPSEVYGACEGNPLPVVQRHPTHPIWTLAPHTPPLSSETGCGVDLSLLPGVVDLGGWSGSSSSVSYLDHGLGRVWFVESDWSWAPSEPSTTDDAGRLFMASMIRGVGTPRHPGVPACSDGVDNDLDGVTDLWDLGCQGQDDMSEAEPNTLPEALTQLRALDIERLAILRDMQVECHDGVDNDLNGLVDFPYDPGCEAMGDQTEAPLAYSPECDDEIDNDGDGQVDWPADRGCAGRGATEEGDALLSAPCSNGRDDDLDGLIDWPDDPSCTASQAHGEHVDSPLRVRLTPAKLLALNPAGAVGLTLCRNELDDDADGWVDEEDPDCALTDGQSEGVPLDAEPNEGVGQGCADGVDNDEDGAIDWPLDLSCVRPDSPDEGDACLFDGALTPGALYVGQIELGDPVSMHSACSRWGEPSSKTLSYEHQGGALNLALSAEQGDIPVSISVRRRCDDSGEVSCQSADELSLTGAMSIPDARAGRYAIQVSALPSAEWSDSDEPLELPADAQGFQANHDLGSQCWQDGGRNAFNCMGVMSLHLGEQSFQLDVSEGQHVTLLDGQPFHYDSAFVSQNVWRVRWSPSRELSVSRRFSGASFELRGSLGAGSLTLSVQAVTSVHGHDLRYMYMTDDFIAPSTPPSLLWIVPSEPSAADLITYEEADGLIRATSPITSPFTIYIATSYLAREELIQLLRARVERRDTRPRLGSFGLTATSGEAP